MAASICLDRPSASEVAQIVRNMRDRDREEVFACRRDNDPDTLIADLLANRDRAVLNGIAHTADGEPAAIFGAYARTPACVECALIATDRWRHVAGAMTRWVRREGLPGLAAAGVRRAEARALARHRDAIAWLILLGGRVECAVPGFGRNGETFIQIALTLSNATHTTP